MGLPRYSGSCMPAMSNISFMGGIDFISPERKFAVAPLSPFWPSHTVTLSIFTPFIASTCMRISCSILSASMSLSASLGSPPAALTISAIPTA